MAKLTITKTREVEVNTLRVDAEVRYWEDADVNGKEDTDGTLIPCRKGDNWMPEINLDTGTILNWPLGTIADVHYKCCDAGIYRLADPDGKIIKEIDGYVPSILYPEENGCGDYIIMKIDAKGKIDKWKVDLSDFEK